MRRELVIEERKPDTITPSDNNDPRLIRPGHYVHYTTYHVPDESGQPAKRHGRGLVEMIRPGHLLPIFIRELKAWVFKRDVSILPRDRWPKQ